MLVRDDPDLQVFMLRRNLNADWVGGAYVFPGGAVDPGDRDRRCCWPAVPTATTPTPARTSASPTVDSDSGSPACARRSKKRGCCSPGRRRRAHWSTRPIRGSRRYGPSSTRVRSTSGTSSGPRTSCSTWGPCRCSHTGSPRKGYTAATTPGSSSLPPPRATPTSTTTVRRSPRSGSGRPTRWRRRTVASWI